MCGIAGLLRRDGGPADGALLKRMTDVLAHRGPDGEGSYLDGPVGLGHRRLSIIDLSTGAQPMSSAGGSVWITYNGEVYNYRELRQELIAMGMEFRTTSDTEVILAAYEAWGVECLQRLRGMFAFAIWDRPRRRIFLARDRVGIKPMVYSWDGRCLRFASEVKAILEDGTVPRALDREALRDYFTHLYVPGPRSIFRDIRKLPPASYLLCSLDGGEPEVRTYWDLRMEADVTVPEAEWVDQLDHLLHEAVRLHLVSDVPVGAFLSGGLDSSLVAAVAKSLAPRRPLRAYTLRFAETSYDEGVFAEQIARHLGLDWTPVSVTPEALQEGIPELIRVVGEPLADPAWVPTALLARRASRDVKLALVGEGGTTSFDISKDLLRRHRVTQVTIHAALAGTVALLLVTCPTHAGSVARAAAAMSPLGWALVVAMALLVTIGSYAVNELYLYLGAYIWFGFIYGMCLQGGRFCFSSAFRDLFAVGVPRMAVGIVIATVLFGLTASMVTASGMSAFHAAPLGIHSVIAGAVFGVGMVFAGGCASSSLYKTGEGNGTAAIVLLSISVTQAALGASVEVPTLDGGRTKLHVPEGTQPGTVLRLRHQGFPHLGSKGRGDLHVLIRVVVPTKLTGEQKKLLEQLAKNLPVPDIDDKDRSLLDRMKDILG